MENNLDPIFRVEPIFPQFVIQTLSESYDWGLIDLNIPQAHKSTMGEGVKVCIVDTGQSTHFETLPVTKEAKNFTTSPTVEDRAGHSTACAGIIAAQKNDEGIIGVAPKCDLYFAKSIDDGSAGDPEAVVRGIKWAIEKEVDIISISAGMFVDYAPIHEAVKEAYAKNIIMVAAAGNSSTRYEDIAFPARYPEVIGVAAYDRTRNIANFSSRGVNVKFAMPGVDIYTTYLNNTYTKLNGTSFSAPILTGVCALILSKHKSTPSLTPCTNTQQMLEHLQKYAINLGDPKAFGFGAVNVDVINY